MALKNKVEKRKGPEGFIGNQKPHQNYILLLIISQTRVNNGDKQTCKLHSRKWATNLYFYNIYLYLSIYTIYTIFYTIYKKSCFPKHVSLLYHFFSCPNFASFYLFFFPFFSFFFFFSF